MTNNKILLLVKRKKSCYAIDVAAIIMNKGNLPHFGLIFDLQVKEAEKMDKRGVLPLTFLLGEHNNPQKWDFLEDDDGMAMLLIPKRYVFLTMVLLAYFVRLVPKETTNTAKV